MFIQPHHRSILLRELQFLGEDKTLTEDQIHETIRLVSNSQMIPPVVLRGLIVSIEIELQILEDDPKELKDNEEDYRHMKQLFHILVLMEELQEPE